MNYTVGRVTGTLEERIFDYLASKAGVEVCEACRDIRYLHCESVRGALERLVRKGYAATVRAGKVTFFCLVRGAERPKDRRGGRHDRR